LIPRLALGPFLSPKQGNVPLIQLQLALIIRAIVLMKVHKPIKEDVGVAIASLLLMNDLKKELDLPSYFLPSLKLRDVIHHLLLSLVSVEDCRSDH
jgi:hypothetical protein